ncbi:MAG: glycosyltransferase family 4 protein [Methanobacteriaceae archaeon]|nr:glycosyltransferase family 4 protein [Methanobacteriaceae archaeon]
MKIAFIYDTVYPWVKGGAEKRIYELARRLVKNGHEVHWYSWGWWWPEKGKKDIILEGIHLHGVGQPHSLYNGNKRSIKEAILFAVKLWPQLNKEKFDIIDCQGFPFFSCITAKIHSIFGKSKLIITFHEVWGDYWYQYLGYLGFFGKLVEKFIFRLTNRIITVSSKTQQDLLKQINASEAKVIPNGIDFKEIIEVKPHKNHHQVVFAGRLIKEKRVDLLIRALAFVKKDVTNIKAIIFGEGPEEQKIKKLADELELSNNITFRGFLENHPDLISHLKSSEVFVLPSEREGFGIIVIESNACGLPVVIVQSSMNAAVDLVNEGMNGFIANSTVEDLAKKITLALHEKKSMSDNCIAFAKKYDWDNIIPVLENYYYNSL